MFVPLTLNVRVWSLVTAKLEVAVTVMEVTSASVPTLALTERLTGLIGAKATPLMILPVGAVYNVTLFAVVILMVAL